MAVKMFAPNYHDIPLFKGLGRDEINEVLHKFHGLIKHFPKSDYIYLAGDCIENLCVVMEGTVQMIKEDIHYCQFERRRCFCGKLPGQAE